MITVLQLAKHRLGRDAVNGQDFMEAKLPMMGGCYVCGASVAAYNSVPTRSGYIACAKGCVDDSMGYETVEAANFAIFGEGEVQDVL